MDEEKWAELLKLRDKACLSPNSDYHFQSLEIVLSAIYTLNLYSQEDKKRLYDQFNELSDKDKEAIINRVTNKTSSSFFHLTYEEMEKLQALRKDLSLHERARLFSNIIRTATGVALLDIGEAFEAKIEIDDTSSPQRWSRPYSYVSFSEGSYRHIETVDILESVNKNPTAIGHPVIVFAIYHWQRVIRAKRVIERDDITTRDEIWASLKREVNGEREVEVAECSLEAIGKNLLKGAKSGAISKEAALAIKLELLGLGLEDTNTILHKAWERIEGKLIDPTDEVEQILVKINDALLAFEKQPHIDIKTRRISAERVMEFLQNQGEKGGNKFVGNDENGTSLRPSWKIFRNTFAAWFFDLDRSTVQEYLEKAAKEDIDSDDVYQYSWISPQSRLALVFHYVLSTQLVMARDAVVVHESSIGFLGLEKAIEEAIAEAAKAEKAN